MEKNCTFNFGIGQLRRIISATGRFWCVMVHKQISTPICGHYRCLRCNRVYPVLWEQPDALFSRRATRIPPHAPQKGVLPKAA